MSDAEVDRIEDLRRYLASGYDGADQYTYAYTLGVALSMLDQILEGGESEWIVRLRFAEWKKRQS